jgi:hypothetical protein
MEPDRLDTFEGSLIMITACFVGIVLIVFGLAFARSRLLRCCMIAGVLCSLLGLGLLWYDRPISAPPGPRYSAAYDFTARRSKLSYAGGILVCFGAYYFTGIFRFRKKEEPVS